MPLLAPVIRMTLDWKGVVMMGSFARLVMKGPILRPAARGGHTHSDAVIA